MASDSHQARDDDRAAVIRETIASSLTTDLNADLIEYECPNCQERCINPRQSVLAEAEVCLECHVQYAAHGHLRGRISSRWD